MEAESEEEAKAVAVARFKQSARLATVNWVREIQRVECCEVPDESCGPSLRARWAPVVPGTGAASLDTWLSYLFRLRMGG